MGSHGLWGRSPPPPDPSWGSGSSVHWEGWEAARLLRSSPALIQAFLRGKAWFPRKHTGCTVPRGGTWLVPSWEIPCLQGLGGAHMEGQGGGGGSLGSSGCRLVLARPSWVLFHSKSPQTG